MVFSCIFMVTYLLTKCPEKMQEDVSKDISKDISEKTVQNKCQKRCQKICQKNDSRYVRIYIYMSETMSEDLSTISEDRSGHLSLSLYISIIRMHVRSKKWSGDMSTLEVCNRVMAQSKEELARLLGGWRASAMQTLGTWCTRRWCPRSLAKLVYHCQNLSLW